MLICRLCRCHYRCWFSIMLRTCFSCQIIIDGHYYFNICSFFLRLLCFHIKWQCILKWHIKLNIFWLCVRVCPSVDKKSFIKHATTIIVRIISIIQYNDSKNKARQNIIMRARHDIKSHNNSDQCASFVWWLNYILHLLKTFVEIKNFALFAKYVLFLTHTLTHSLTHSDFLFWFVLFSIKYLNDILASYFCYSLCVIFISIWINNKH